MRTVYIADDGKEFKNRYDCEIYEADKTFIDKQYPICTDIYGNFITFDDLSTIEKEIGKISFIFAHNGKELKNLCEIFDWFGFHYENIWTTKPFADVPSSWTWNDFHNQWDNLDEKILRYERLKAIRDTYLKGE